MLPTLDIRLYLAGDAPECCGQYVLHEQDPAQFWDGEALVDVDLVTVGEWETVQWLDDFLQGLGCDLVFFLERLGED